MPVYAVGGSASIGKTTVAAHLAEMLGGSTIIHVDDLVHRAEPEGVPPFLHATTNPWQQPSVALATKLIESTAMLHPAIIDAAGALHSDGLTIEGEGVDPRLIQEWSHSVSVVYMIEGDRHVLCPHRQRTISGGRHEPLLRPLAQGGVRGRGPAMCPVPPLGHPRPIVRDGAGDLSGPQPLTD